jgi:succinate dehydrogenase/fumarate reductase flavoprotein subunit
MVFKDRQRNRLTGGYFCPDLWAIFGRMEEISTDILVIGSGLAGIAAALEAERYGLQVLILGKFAIGMGTNSSMAGGFFTAANSHFSKEDHLQATLECGRGLNHFQLVKTLIGRGPDAVQRLREFGVPLVERGTGYEVKRPEASSQLTGVLLIKALVERLKGSSVRFLAGLNIFELVIEEGEVRGAFGFFRDGKPCLIRSKTVILATGGAGGIYLRNDNQKSILGDGYALALRAGLSLFDLEFVQFYPFVLAEPRLSPFILLPPYQKKMRLLDEKGENPLGGLDIRGDFNQAIVHQRDRLSIGLFEASRKGDVYCDLTQVPEEKWNDYPFSFLMKSKFPFRERVFLISPAVHFFMGGIEIDEDGKTRLPGLFAAGEVVWGIHGANRLGGNALTECAVFGMIGGRSAAEYSRHKESGDTPSSFFSEAFKKRWERKANAYMKKRRGVFDHPRDLAKDLRNVAWKHASPVRDEESLKEGLARLASIEARIERVYPATLKDLFSKKDLENMVLLLKVILKGSLLRTESRGSFFRKDFPHQEDRSWLKSTCYRLGKGELEITHREIVS